MSYSFENLNSLGGIQTASVNWATGADANSTILIPTAPASQAYIIDWVTFAASSFGALWLEQATGNASAGVGGSSYFKMFTGQNAYQEETRIVTTAGKPVILEVQSGVGNGILRCNYRTIKASTTTPPYANVTGPDV